MYTDGLMNSKSEFRSGSLWSFPKGENMILFFHNFESSNEEKWVGNRKMVL